MLGWKRLGGSPRYPFAGGRQSEYEMTNIDCQMKCHGTDKWTGLQGDAAPRRLVQACY